jgi:hypothetical protein
MASAMLAMEHFNAWDPQVESELAELSTCNVHFPFPSDNHSPTNVSSVFADDGGNADAASRAILEYL